jgi:hypothetical protein
VGALARSQCRMLHPTFVRALTLSPSDHPRKQPHLSAASGLVRVGQRLYVAADDEHHLGELSLDDDRPVRLHRFRTGELPAGKGERKRAKPDLEALTWLPGPGGGQLVAMGSGSRPNRESAFVFALDAAGALVGEPRERDLAPLYAPLHAHFGELNIEGAFVAGSTFRLLQRANQGEAVNACIEYELAAIEAFLARGRAPTPLRIVAVDLGMIDGVALGFTDGVSLPDGSWLFSAVAEDTQDSYQDGACAAAVLGHVSTTGERMGQARLAGGPKVEGIALAADGGLWLVTDADDPAAASQLFSIGAGDIAALVRGG